MIMELKCKEENRWWVDLWIWLGGSIIVEGNNNYFSYWKITKSLSNKTRLKYFFFPWTKEIGVKWYQIFPSWRKSYPSGMDIDTLSKIY